MVLMAESEGVGVVPAGGTAVAERPAEVTVPQTPWVTIVWDDPVNLMSYVTHVFQTYFGYSKTKAMERDVTAMQEYGLWATLDKADEL